MAGLNCIYKTKLCVKIYLVISSNKFRAKKFFLCPVLCNKKISFTSKQKIYGEEVLALPISL